MNPKSPPPVVLSVSVTTPVVRQLDQQLLECVEGESLSAAQQAELLAWAHCHLLSVYVALHLDASPDPAAPSADKRLIDPCTGVVEIISNMLLGEVPVEEDLTFRCPPVCCERSRALSNRLSVWVRRRIELAAQRTRWHTDAELAALWAAVEAHLITGCIARFGLADLLKVKVPALRGLEPTTRGCLQAMWGTRGLAWRASGAVWR